MTSCRRASAICVPELYWGSIMDEVTGPELPDWVSVEVRRYLEHTVAQVSIRELARKADCHASTVLRQIRRMETLREDLLVDGALQRLTDVFYDRPCNKDGPCGKTYFSEEDTVHCLTLLSHSGAVLAASRDMPKVLILRELDDEIQKTVVARGLAEVLALRDWIACFASGRVYRYRITKEGRQALADLLAAAEQRRRSRQESLTQSGVAGVIACHDTDDRTSQRRPRYGIQETPLQVLARLTDRDGNPFLTPEMIRAGERLREDFELAQIGQHVAREQAVFADKGSDQERHDLHRPAQEAFQRASNALCALGPGLNDIALRCCCHLEGLEAAERELGWSARSGKIVLRIALAQLHEYYSALPPQSQMIG
ncbi:DUF6456 domain-containing protein [Epibacterium sp. MM17-32]|uniref:DUF6456 domain-containing protein n=1 Tax=Epibacterium sp. MM17-32 TaxID=2917734 RepID=UPI00351E0790